MLLIPIWSCLFILVRRDYLINFFSLLLGVLTFVVISVVIPPVIAWWHIVPSIASVIFPVTICLPTCIIIVVGVTLVRNIDVEVDNRWVVPYSPLLSKTFKAHINVEYCNSVKSIKYIYKYVNKGSDMAVFGVENRTGSIDEINQYQLGRYISNNFFILQYGTNPIIHENSSIIIIEIIV